jgi:hypothetical protein
MVTRIISFIVIIILRDRTTGESMKSGGKYSMSGKYISRNELCACPRRRLQHCSTHSPRLHRPPPQQCRNHGNTFCSQITATLFAHHCSFQLLLLLELQVKQPTQTWLTMAGVPACLLVCVCVCVCVFG